MLFKRFWILFLVYVLSCSPVMCTQPPLFPHPAADLAKQDKALIRDLKLLNYPPLPWKINAHDDADYDVVIVGAGMAGLAAGAALFKEGIYHIKIFDENEQGQEGPWVTYARMKTLRSQKELMGPALDIPHLTFRAWFEAQWGQEAWKGLNKIPNHLWMNYLDWYRQAMQLPIENCCKLLTITPGQNCLELEFQKAGHPFVVKARKVVLATGRGGFGGACLPAVIQELPRFLYAHTVESISFETLKAQRIAILGAGASAFDAAATALEAGAKSVDLLMRRARLPNVNKWNCLYYKSFSHGYYYLSDEQRWSFMCAALDAGNPPPIEVLKRIQGSPHFQLRPSMSISRIYADGSEIKVESNQGTFTYDFMILGTGFEIDGHQQPELRLVIDQIALWQDRLSAERVKHHPRLGRYPYLGPHFEFLPKQTGMAPYLKNLYCFNYGATLSHALLSSDIPAISIGARRLAEGIAADFFIEGSEHYLERLKNYQEQDFDQDQFFLSTHQ